MKIFICANDEQSIPAKVSRTLLIEQEFISSDSIEIIYEKDFSELTNFFGQKFLRSGNWETFEKDDLQRFTLLRFKVPELMNYKGLALVIDPDIFIIQNKLPDLFNRIKTHKLLCRKGIRPNSFASSLMLLQCDLLKDWNLENFINELKDGRLDYEDLINLRNCDDNIGILEDFWNDFDNLNKNTVFLHTTQKITQPWRKGLELNSYIPPFFGFLKRDLIYKILRKPLRIGVEHPIDDINQVFFKGLNKAITRGQISSVEIDKAIKKGFLRIDIHSKIKN